MSAGTLADLIAKTSLPNEPMRMPAAHVSSLKWLGKIIDAGCLIPTFCKVFSREVLYLFYGGILYRPSNKPTKQDLELPVAFVFDPVVLNDVHLYFPFDTGAIASGRFGTWSANLRPFEPRFGVPGGGTSITAARLVARLFNDNKSYLKGSPNPSLTGEPEPLPLLHSFYTSDLTGGGTDHR